MNHRRRQVRWALLMSLILLCFCVNAQTNALQGSSATPSPAAETHDKSGTNPLVLRHTVQIFTEYYNLPGGGLYNNITKFRFIAPFARQYASFKVDCITYYATPGFPIGGNRPYDFTFKTGVKKIW